MEKQYLTITVSDKYTEIEGEMQYSYCVIAFLKLAKYVYTVILKDRPDLQLEVSKHLVATLEEGVLNNDIS